MKKKGTKTEETENDNNTKWIAINGLSRQNCQVSWG